jgi:hypothetical protein
MIFAALPLVGTLASNELNSEPDLDPRNLPPYRKVQEADKNKLLDELGNHLRTAEHLKPGPISEDRRTNILGKAVAFYYQELVRLVA